MRVSEASLPLSWEGGAVGGVSHLPVRSDRTAGRGSLPVTAAYPAVFARVSFRLVKILISYGTDVNLRNGSGKDRRVRGGRASAGRMGECGEDVPTTPFARVDCLDAEVPAVPLAAGVVRSRTPQEMGGSVRSTPQERGWW